MIKQVRLYGEMHRFIPALAARLGARITEMEVHHRPRTAGTTKYNLSRTSRVLMDLLTVYFLGRFSARPMHMIGVPGILAFLVGGGIATYLTVQKLVFGAELAGRPLLILAVLLLIVGVQFFGMGLMSELLARIYHETTQNKTYTVKNEIQNGAYRYAS